ncbi:hypothetical protein AB0Q95_13200 [Streptomyces sp. NPDC059900]|uniref:hypothetical protein n=1 Tax=Streptomyces sp. NPDC059900 TaxID=3155816 RepID=UPI00344537FB
MPGKPSRTDRTVGTRPGRRLPLDLARECFDLLVAGPSPLSLDCRNLPGLPDGPIPLDELLDRLLSGHCPRATKDAVWPELVRRSRSEGATWTLACTGMALPTLAKISGQLTARYPADPADVHAEVLCGFLAALSTVDLGRPRVLVRLKWAAYRRGLATLSRELDAPTPMGPGFDSAPPRHPWGHPDLVLASAVRAGVLTRTEADLIGTTRLDDESVTDWAITHKATPGSVYKARRRAEYRLIDFLREGVQTGGAEDPVARAAMARWRKPRDYAARSSQGAAVTVRIPQAGALGPAPAPSLRSACPKAPPEAVFSGAGACHPLPHPLAPPLPRRSSKCTG